jgi:carotenoid 1,2-hydratase
VGSVFSPYYHWAFQRDPHTDPENHCCINVALYGRGARRWTMTERGKRHMSRSADQFHVGPSGLHWNGQCLEISIHERSLPFGQRVAGTIRVFPEQLFHFVTPLDQRSRHHWGPIAPSARVEVVLDAPNMSWNGHAYLDSNEGAEPVIHGFHEWDWSRANMADGSVSVLYDIREKSDTERLLALRFHRDGRVDTFDAPPRQSLPKAFWRVGRSIRSEDAHPPRVAQTLEDTPFYIRSVIESTLLGERVTSMHETLNIPRLDSTTTRLMLPFKMPRIP